MNFDYSFTSILHTANRFVLIRVKNNQHRWSNFIL